MTKKEILKLCIISKIILMNQDVVKQQALIDKIIKEKKRNKDNSDITIREQIGPAMDEIKKLLDELGGDNDTSNT